jgi:hypothetical protein
VETCSQLKGKLLKIIFFSANKLKYTKRALSPEVEWPSIEADHPTPSNAQIKNTLSYSSTSPYAIVVCPGIIYSLQ